MPTEKKPEQPIIPFASRDAWEAWLEEHHTASDGLWLRFAKKGSGLETVTYDQAVGPPSATAERRPGAQVRRVLLPATVHAAQAQEQVVEDQPPKGHGTHRAGRDEARGVPRRAYRERCPGAIPSRSVRQAR